MTLFTIRKIWILLLTIILLANPCLAGFWIGQANNPNAGWTVFTPVSAGATGLCDATDPETCIAYVASVGNGGNDSTCVLQPQPVTTAPTHPCLTPDKAESIARNNKPDWVLLHKGDVFTAGFSNVSNSGTSCTTPHLIWSYGTSTTMPSIRPTNASPNFLNSSGNTNTYLAIMGIDFYAVSRDPSSGSFSVADAHNSNFVFPFTSTYTCLLFEGNWIRFASGGFGPIRVDKVAQGSLTYRRNVISNIYDSNSRSEGVFFSDTGSSTLFENFFIQNGWNSTLGATVSITMNAASPGTFTYPGTMYLLNGDTFAFSTSGNGVSAGTQYCVANVSGNTFQLKSGGCAGTLVNTTAGTQSGGWADLSATLNNSTGAFSQNIYLDCRNGPSSLTGNLTAQAAGNGLQDRPGNTVNNNLSLQNSVAYLIESCNPVNFGQTTTASYNVALEGAIQFAANSWGLTVSPTGPIIIDHNIVAHSQNSASAANGYVTNSPVVSFTGTASPTVGTVSGYIDSNNPSLFSENETVTLAGTYPAPLTAGTTYFVRNFNTTTGSFNLSLTAGPGGALINTTNSTGTCTSPVSTTCFMAQTIDTNVFSNNIGCDWSNPMISNQAVNVTQSGNTFQNTSCSGFPDSTRTVGGYYGSIGGSPSTTQGYLNAVLLLNRDNWNPALLAVNVNCYIQTGFGFSCPGGG